METGPENHKLLVPKSFVKDRVQLPKVGPDPVVSWLRHLADEVLVEIDQQFSGPRGHGLCSAADLQRPSVENWCRKRDSNPRPPLYESGALPAELLRHRAAIVARMERSEIRESRIPLRFMRATATSGHLIVARVANRKNRQSQGRPAHNPGNKTRAGTHEAGRSVSGRAEFQRKS